MRYLDVEMSGAVELFAFDFEGNGGGPLLSLAPGLRVEAEADDLDRLGLDAADSGAIGTSGREEEGPPKEESEVRRLA